MLSPRRPRACLCCSSDTKFIVCQPSSGQCCSRRVVCCCLVACKLPKRSGGDFGKTKVSFFCLSFRLSQGFTALLVYALQPLFFEEAHAWSTSACRFHTGLP